MRELVSGVMRQNVRSGALGSWAEAVGSTVLCGENRMPLENDVGLAGDPVPARVRMRKNGQRVARVGIRTRVGGSRFGSLGLRRRRIGRCGWRRILPAREARRGGPYDQQAENSNRELGGRARHELVVYCSYQNRVLASQNRCESERRSSAQCPMIERMNSTSSLLYGCPSV